ncbi:MAG: hypothetical protein HOW73_21795 [Polyangiaceae bacterium]|nr:hypothetical protein [Polyangiaceae bacterium]
MPGSSERSSASPGAVAILAFVIGVASIIGIAVLRGPYGPAEAVASAQGADDEGDRPGNGRSKASSSASASHSSSARVSSTTAAEASTGEPAATAEPEVASDAETALAQFKDRWRARDTKGAIAAAERLAELDKDAFKDNDLQSDLVGLTQQMSQMPGKEAERVFTLLTKKTAPYGLDVLLYLVTNKGGSLAADISEKLLEKPEILQRGTKAMQVAYKLRKASCPKKKDFFKEAGEVGDRRALGQLQIISKTSCGRRNTCCYEKDKDLDAAEAAIEARLGQ